MMIVKNLFLFILLNLLSFSMIAQDRGEGAWWPSIHGADDEAGATSAVPELTPAAGAPAMLIALVLPN